MGVKRMMGFNIALTEIVKQVKQAEYESNFYRASYGNYTLEISISCLFHNVVDTDLKTGLPFWVKSLASVELEYCEVHNSIDSFDLDPKQLEVLCKELNANNVINR